MSADRRNSQQMTPPRPSLPGSCHVSELRKDPLVPRWVVMAPERAQRPVEVKDEPRLSASQFDPFGEGNERETTSEVLAYRRPGSRHDGPGWRVRVVPNKFPALHAGIDTATVGDGLYQSMPAFGIHEVIIECPHDEANLSRLSLDNIREVLTAYRDRFLVIKRDSRLAHAIIFKNQGALAGASVHHSHSQLIATPYVPAAILEELTGAADYYERHGRCVFDDIIRQEQKDASRMVAETANFILFCPYASRFAYETCLLPKNPSSHFENIQDSDLGELAALLKLNLQRLEECLGNPPLNYVLHSAPFQTPEFPCYRWHFEVFPRLTRIAGYEWGSGCYINEVLPEVAAAKLRQSSDK